MTKKRKTYTDEEKAAALATLAAEGGKLKKAARILGLSPSTLRGWRNAPYVVPPEVQEPVAGKLDELLEKIALQLATGIGKPEAIARLLAKPTSAAVTMGIAVDKVVNLRRSTTDESRMSLADFLSAARWIEDVKGGGEGRKPAQGVPSLAGGAEAKGEPTARTN